MGTRQDLWLVDPDDDWDDLDDWDDKNWDDCYDKSTHRHFWPTRPHPCRSTSVCIKGELEFLKQRVSSE